MSIALLGSVYEDLRRVAVAGSTVAPGDFRLKKHIAPLEAAGAKAPVFAKIAEQVRGVVESTEATSANAVLELASLVSAVLYTQGDASAPGEMTEIESTELDLAASGQTSARMLKPLLEALTNTGGGRLELIRDAYARDGFKDLRLVKPSLAALDDGYGEIADFVAEKVLPLYGRAILPELRAKFDIKGKQGHARRLGLMHTLDPEGSREMVKTALADGSKEVKIAAIECLGADDLDDLVEMASAKVQDVRRAAYMALATVDNPAAVKVFESAVNGKDVQVVSEALRKCRMAQVHENVLGAITASLLDLKSAKDKKTVSAGIHRLEILLGTLHGRDDDKTETLLLGLFARREEFLKLKGDTDSGVDLNQSVVTRMASSTPKVRDALATQHAKLTADELHSAFDAARHAWPAARVHQEFSPYVAPDKKAKAEAAKKDAILGALNADRWTADERKAPALDEKWLDSVIAADNVDLLDVVGRPGHAAQNKYLTEKFLSLFKGKKNAMECQRIIAAMVKVQHPEATDRFIQVVELLDKKSYWHSYYFEWMIPDLPADAIPKLEALVPKLGERDADRWVDRIEQLRQKHKTS